MHKFWTERAFIEAVKKSNSISEVLRCFDLPTNRGSYYNKLFHQSVKDLNLDISHFKPFKNNGNFAKIAIKDILIKGIFKSTSKLRKRLIKEGLLEEKCYECNLTPMWNGKALTLQLDHIDGDNTNNTLENLRLLCPNCHSQTETFSGAKAKKEKHKYKFVCKLCGGPKKKSSSEVCFSCVPKVISGKFKIEWPEITVILDMLKANNFVYVAKQLGVTDNAIRKFLKRNNINPKTLK